MGKRQLLFITYYSENFNEGLSYVIDLAKIMNRGITALMIYKKRLTEKFEDFLKLKTSIDMVLLSPSVTNNEGLSAKELKRLVRTVSRPIVTMARNVKEVS